MSTPSTPASPPAIAIASDEATTPDGDYIPLMFRVDPDDEDLSDLSRFVGDEPAPPAPLTMNQRIRRAAGRKQ